MCCNKKPDMKYIRFVKKNYLKLEVFSRKITLEILGYLKVPDGNTTRLSWPFFPTAATPNK